MGTESENYCRLQMLLIEAGGEALRTVINNELQRRNTDLNTILTLVQPYIQQFQNRQLHQTQWDKLYPTTGQADLSEMDISLLCFLLRFVLGFNAPSSGWNQMPPAVDVSIEADIVRLRIHRNDTFAHRAHSTIKRLEFEDLKKEISDVCVRLGGQAVHTIVTQVLSAPLDVSKDKQYGQAIQEWYYSDLTIKDQLSSIQSMSKDQNQEVLEKIENQQQILLSTLKKDSDLVKKQLEEQKSLLIQTAEKQTPFQVQERSYLDAWLENDVTFVETSSSSKARDTLHFNRRLCITGNQGVGKTALAKHLVLRFVRQGYRVIRVQSVSQLKQQCKPSEEQVIFVDNIFGTSKKVPSWLEKWNAFADEIMEWMSTGNIIFICTSRKSVWADCAMDSQEVSLFARCLELDDGKLTIEEKCEILDRHAAANVLHIDSYKKARIAKCNPSVGYAFCCWSFCTVREIFDQGEEYFKKPSHVLLTDIKRIQREEKEKFCLMAMVLMSNGKLPVTIDESNLQPHRGNVIDINGLIHACSLPSNTTLRMILESANALSRVYTDVVDGEIVFCHDAFADATCFALVTSNRRAAFRSCSPAFFEERLTFSESHIPSDCCVRITVEDLPLLAEVAEKHVYNGNPHSVFHSHIIEDKGFRRTFIDKLYNSGNSEIAFIEEYKRTVLEIAGERGFADVLTCLLDLLQSQRYNAEKYTLILGNTLCLASRGGHREIVCYLLHHGTNVNHKYEGTTPVMWAVLKGHVEIMELLLQNGADITISDNLGRTGVTYAELGNNVSLLIKLLRYGHLEDSPDLMYDVVKKLINKRSEESRPAIYEAVKETEALFVLSKASKGGRYMDIFALMCTQWNFLLPLALEKDKSGLTPLMYAANALASCSLGIYRDTCVAVASYIHKENQETNRELSDSFKALASPKIFMCSMGMYTSDFKIGNIHLLVHLADTALMNKESSDEILESMYVNGTSFLHMMSKSGSSFCGYFIHITQMPPTPWFSTLLCTKDKEGMTPLQYALNDDENVCDQMRFLAKHVLNVKQEFGLQTSPEAIVTASGNNILHNAFNEALSKIWYILIKDIPNSLPVGLSACLLERNQEGITPIDVFRKLKGMETEASKFVTKILKVDGALPEDHPGFLCISEVLHFLQVPSQKELHSNAPSTSGRAKEEENVFRGASLASNRTGEAPKTSNNTLEFKRENDFGDWVSSEKKKKTGDRNRWWLVQRSRESKK